MIPNSVSNTIKDHYFLQTGSIQLRKYFDPLVVFTTLPDFISPDAMEEVVISVPSEYEDDPDIFPLIATSLPIDIFFHLANEGIPLGFTGVEDVFVALSGVSFLFVFVSFTSSSKLGKERDVAMPKKEKPDFSFKKYLGRQAAIRENYEETIGDVKIMTVNQELEDLLTNIPRS
jgi:hypothetical protein